MSLFFVTPPKRLKTTQTERSTIESCRRWECQACPLNNADVKHPKMEPTGSDHPLAYLLGEAPGKIEDERGEQFVGESGQLLRKHIPDEFVDKVRFNNSVRTRPPRNRTPVWQEIEACRPSIIRDVEATKPKAIFGFGAVPLRWVLGSGAGSISVWRGRKIPVRIGSHTCWFFPMFHPAYIIRQGGRGGFETKEQFVFRRDLENAFSSIADIDDACIPTKDEVTEGITTVYPTSDEDGVLDQVHNWLHEQGRAARNAVDIETSSKRPYAKDARIVSMSVTGPTGTLAFPVHHKIIGSDYYRREIVKIIKDYLKTAKAVKVCHNLAFEIEWFGVVLGRSFVRAGRWDDTMTQAYVLDERRGGLGLDALITEHFGFSEKSVIDIDREKVEASPIPTILVYNGIDSKWTYKLDDLQTSLLKKQGLIKVNDEQVRSVPTMVHTQISGVHVNQGEVKAQAEDLGKVIGEIIDDIEALPELHEFKKRSGHDFSPDSQRDVGFMLDKILGRKEGYRGPDLSYSTDESILEKIDLPFAKLQLEYRKIAKLKSTYIDSINESTKGKWIWPDHLLHPSYNTVFTRTGRTSADSPNMQNFPVREFGEIRATIIPPPGCKLIKADYGQIEHRTFGMATLDENLIDELRQGYDVHMDWAKYFATEYPRWIDGKKFRDDEKTMKAKRQDAKTWFVFPSWYGAQPPSISENLGIPEQIIDRAQDRFWQRYPRVRDWQDRVWQKYQKVGYVETLAGLRRRAPLSKNEALNMPIQGTAAQIVIRAMSILSELAQKTDDWKYQAYMLIHDDLPFALPKNRLDYYLEQIVTTMLSVDYDFINVPLTVELAEGPNWFDMKKIGTFDSEKDL